MAKYTDEQFEDGLRKYLAQFSEGQEPDVPLLLEEGTSGSILRTQTLALVCYGTMPEDVKADLLS